MNISAPGFGKRTKDPNLVDLVEQYLTDNWQMAHINIEDMVEKLQCTSYRYIRMKKLAFTGLVNKAYHEYCERKGGISGGKLSAIQQQYMQSSLKPVQDIDILSSDSDVEIEEQIPRVNLANNQLSNMYSSAANSSSSSQITYANKSQNNQNQTSPLKRKRVDNSSVFTLSGSSSSSVTEFSTLPNEANLTGRSKAVLSPLNDATAVVQEPICHESDNDLEIIEEVSGDKNSKSANVSVKPSMSQNFRNQPSDIPSQLTVTSLPANYGNSGFQDATKSDTQSQSSDRSSSNKNSEKKQNKNKEESNSNDNDFTTNAENKKGIKRKAVKSDEFLSLAVPKKLKREVEVTKKAVYKLDDFAGSENVIGEICKLLMHLKHPEIYKCLGVTPPRGFLLHGPPGCGKTLLANAIAGELEMPLLKMAATELVSGVSGESESNIRDLFNQALGLAPCIVFIDEIDAVTPKRETAQREMERRIVAQLLACIDDLSTKEKGDQVLLIGATNRIEAIDTGLRRAGRFDREICLGIPDVHAREKIMRVICRGLRLKADFDFELLAKLTPGYVGADLQALTREAAVQAVNTVLIAPKVAEMVTEDNALAEKDDANASESNSALHSNTNLDALNVKQINKGNLNGHNENDIEMVEMELKLASDSGKDIGHLDCKIETENDMEISVVDEVPAKSLVESKKTSNKDNVAETVDLESKTASVDASVEEPSKKNKILSSENSDVKHVTKIATVEKLILKADVEENNQSFGDSSIQSANPNSKLIVDEIPISNKAKIKTECKQMGNSVTEAGGLPKSALDVSDNSFSNEQKDVVSMPDNKMQLDTQTVEEKNISNTGNTIVKKIKPLIEKTENRQNAVDDSPQRWIKDIAPLNLSQLDAMFICMEDFVKALKIVQPSAKREGFATVPDITWDDIGALQDIRDELQVAILGPVKHASEFMSLGLNTPAGSLLCGPPGVGKTLLAKAVANEAGINFISVKGPELLNMYVGESERAVRQCFLRAKNSAPCVIFFDELDALCPRRSEVAESGSGSRIVNQLLTEMDGMESRLGVFVMAATNRPDIIDPAILRPGRLDKIFFVDFPSVSDRLEILKAITKSGTKPVLDADVNLEEIASNTLCENYTGADLAALVREASIAAFRELVLNKADDEKNQRSLKVSKRHFVFALSKTRPSVSKSDREKYEKMKLKFSSIAER